MSWREIYQVKCIGLGDRFNMKLNSMRRGQDEGCLSGFLFCATEENTAPFSEKGNLQESSLGGEDGKPTFGM